MPDPFLKWAGGKRKLAPRIWDLLGDVSEGAAYWEPFLGSGSVFLARAPARAHLSDQNLALVRTFQEVRSFPKLVHALLLAMPHDEHWKDAYTRIRQEYNENKQIGSIHQAARFIWLNRACFNGLYRENRSGKFNVPAGSYATVNLPTLDHLLSVSEALQDTILCVDDFRNVLDQVQPGDRVYCDPPYDSINSAGFTAYSGKFTRADQEALADGALQAAERGARVVLSNAATPYIVELYQARGFELHSLEVGRSISCDGARRRAASEVLAVVGQR